MTKARGAIAQTTARVGFREGSRANDRGGFVVFGSGTQRSVGLAFQGG